ncbi:unnamed protein product [Phytophthora lilii]|uniref:Unnamed protein product n=1 Tax=Phytophthora lilii TaxID=2077276 RepID=A0A9W6TDE9_9STRA|nr:unnamed protein product [Phytophthora lilii]
MAAAPPPYASFVQPNADAQFPAEKDRYHLYVSYACPFASRALSARYLKGLEDVVGLTVAHPIHQKTKPDDDNDTRRVRSRLVRDGGPGATQVLGADPVGQEEEDHRVGRLRRHPSDVNSAFNDIVPFDVDIVPKELESEVDAANNGIVMEISGPYFKAAFAHDAESSQAELAKVFG